MIKYLGIIVDDEFNWKPHVDFVCRRLRSCTYGIYKLPIILEERTLVIIYKALAESIMRYGVLAWGNTTMDNLIRIKKLQKALLRIIDKKRKTKELFQFYKCLPIDFLFKLIFIANNYFNNEFKVPVLEAHDRRTTTRYKRFIDPMYTNKYGRRELKYLVPKIFNEVPREIINLKGIGSVKKEVTAWLFNTIIIIIIIFKMATHPLGSWREGC